MKILIIRFSSIGDIVLTTPVIRCLKQQLGAEIHYLTKKSFHAVLAANPYIDKIIIIQKEVNEALTDLKKEKYDYIIDLHHNLRSWQVKRALGVKSFSFNKINFHKWLIVNLKINYLPKAHIVDRYLAAVKKLGVVNDGKGLDYFIPESEELAVSSEQFAALVQPPTSNLQPFIAFVIGAAHATKRLPTDKIISICKKIKHPIILLGGPEDAPNGEIIAQSAGNHVINACGKLKLNQSASLVKQAWKVITHDTGLMHIAAAFNKDIISVWGNTIPEFGMYPYYPEGENKNKTLEVRDLSCRPCSKIGYDKCPKGHFNCMQNIDEKIFTSL
ncbi:MAG: glycosyltransferase family 9 protein [Saprospiraceae bacterium]|nr:glycosyltransferase family 9 protein [Saprospiraceae bacterium]